MLRALRAGRAGGGRRAAARRGGTAGPSARRRGGRRTRACARRRGSPVSATTFQVGRLGRKRRRNHSRPPPTSSQIAAAANAPTAAASARPRRPPRRASRPAAPASAFGHAEREPVAAVRALLLDRARSQPNSASCAAIHCAASCSPGEAEGRSIAARWAIAWRRWLRSGTTARRLPICSRRAHRFRGLPLLQDRRGRAAGDDRRRGRAHARLHGHQPGDARPRARDPARARDRPARDRARRPAGVRARGAAARRRA